MFNYIINLKYLKWLITYLPEMFDYLRTWNVDWVYVTELNWLNSLDAGLATAESGNVAGALIHGLAGGDVAIAVLHGRRAGVCPSTLRPRH